MEPATPIALVCSDDVRWSVVTCSAVGCRILPGSQDTSASEGIPSGDVGEAAVVQEVVELGLAGLAAEIAAGREIDRARSSASLVSVT